MVGLIFDVDGVVGDTESINEIASVAAVKELTGATVQREDFRAFVGMGSERYVEGVLEKYGLTTNLGRAVALRQEKILDLLWRGGLAPYPGVREIIAAASASPDVALAIATSGPPDLAFPILAAAGIDRRVFKVIITGRDVTRKKPDPAIYRLAGERLGLTPVSCVVIEDAPAGVTAAKAAGMRCVAVTNTVGRDHLAHADRVVASLAEITLDDVRKMGSGPIYHPG